MGAGRGEPAVDLSDPRVLLAAYQQGVFPMSDGSAGEIALYEADPRGVMPLTEAQGLHVPRSVERVIRSGRFTVTSDRAFERVVRGCAAPRPDDGVWLSKRLIAAMVAMHEAGPAHSVEAWRTDPKSGQPVVVGGIYGVSVGRVFCAESMFCLPLPRNRDGTRHPLDGTDASKVCLVALIRHLHACGYAVLDIQMVSPHTARFGARNVSRRVYLGLIGGLVTAPDAWRPLGA